ncbi:uncharacterized protein SCHCODRAFT_0111595 [Schizophyllum commune H4-8]
MKFSFALFTIALAAVATAAPTADIAVPELVARDQLADHISCPILDCAKALASKVGSCAKAATSLGRNVIADAQCLAGVVSTVTNAVQLLPSSKGVVFYKVRSFPAKYPKLSTLVVPNSRQLQAVP